jgi:enoyl-[acyl-carrier protein] reductase I
LNFSRKKELKKTQPLIIKKSFVYNCLVLIFFKIINLLEQKFSTLMAGKKGLVVGIANKDSIAWGIAQTLADHGAQVAVTYQNEILKKRVVPLGQSIQSPLITSCNISCEKDVMHLVEQLTDVWGSVDFIVHAVAFSDKNELTGPYYLTSRENFLNSLDVSCYSFTYLIQKMLPLLKQDSSLLTLSYLGAERVVPHYNVMGVAKAALEASIRYLAVDLGPQGIRVNGLSPGPIKTLAASGIGDFRYILKWNQYNSPLRRNVTQEEVGGAALFLLSDLAKGVTGELIHVDCGYHVVGMKAVDAPDITKVKNEDES